MSAVLILLIIFLLVCLIGLGYIMLVPNSSVPVNNKDTKDSTDNKDNTKDNKDNKDSTPTDANNLGTKLTVGQNLLAGQYIQNGTFKLIYQSDNNLVYYNDTSPIWASNTEVKTANKMAFNGNINVIDNSNTINYSTNLIGGTLLDISTSGSLTIQDANKNILWTASSSNSGTPTPISVPAKEKENANSGCTGINGKYTYIDNNMLNGHFLDQCQGIQSSNKQFKLVMQSDGNLVAYDTNSTNPKATWASNTVNKGTGPYIARLQDDGNLAIVASGNNTIWSANPDTPTKSQGNIYKLNIDDNGRPNLLYSDQRGSASNSNYWHA